MSGGGGGMGMGLLGAGLGALGSRKAQKSAKHQRYRIEQRETAGLEDIQKVMDFLQQSPHLQQLGTSLLQQMGMAPSPELLRSMYDFTTGQVANLFNQPYGLSDPRVRENIFSSAVEGTLQPQYDRTRSQTESQYAARGLGRSGLAAATQREQDYQYSKDVADLRRSIDTQGALQAMQDQMAKIQMARQQQGIGQGMLGQAQQGLGGYGFGMGGAMGQLAQAMAGTRMNAASLIGGMPIPQNPMQTLGAGLYGMSSPMMQYGLGQQRLNLQANMPYLQNAWANYPYWGSTWRGMMGSGQGFNPTLGVR